MAEVRLPFQARWAPLVLSGAKTTTVRTRRHGAPGDSFELAGARFELVEVAAMPLREARDRLWRDEGASSPTEFEAVWRENHPTRGFRGEDSVWAHRFRRARE